MSTDFLDQLKEFTLEHAFAADNSINQNTRIYQDLKMTGFEAIEFLFAYSKRFNVDLSEFPAKDYFEDEGMNILVGNGIAKKELTLDDLLNGILQGKLKG